MHRRNVWKCVAASLAFGLLMVGLGTAALAAAQKKDYLTRTEANKIRDADTIADRIKLFLAFATDRITKLQYELDHPGTNTRPEERANNLIINYANCIDDAVDLIELGAEKQQDIRPAIKLMQMQAPDFLAYLKGLAGQGRKMAAYKDNLDDAIEATQSALKSADEAARTIAPPVRRPQ